MPEEVAGNLRMSDENVGALSESGSNSSLIGETDRYQNDAKMHRREHSARRCAIGYADCEGAAVPGREYEAR
jgi:hypothetical protein